MYLLFNVREKYSTLFNIVEEIYTLASIRPFLLSHSSHARSCSYYMWTRLLKQKAPPAALIMNKTGIFIIWL